VQLEEEEEEEVLRVGLAGQGLWLREQEQEEGLKGAQREALQQAMQLGRRRVLWRRQ